MGIHTSSVPVNFVPSAGIFLYDEFLTNNTTGIGQLNWNDVGAGGTGSGQTKSATNLAGHPGIIQLSTGTTTTGGAGLALGTAGSGSVVNGLILESNVLTLEYDFNLSALSNVTDEYYLQFGLVAHTNANTQNNEVTINYDRAVSDGNWQCVVSKGGSHTTTDSGVVVATGWNKIRIQAKSTAIIYTINGTVISGQANTNIPTVAMVPIFRILKSAGTTAVTFDMDYFLATLTFSTSR